MEYMKDTVRTHTTCLYVINWIFQKKKTEKGTYIHGDIVNSCSSCSMSRILDTFDHNIWNIWNFLLGARSLVSMWVTLYFKRKKLKKRQSFMEIWWFKNKGIICVKYNILLFMTFGIYEIYCRDPNYLFLCNKLDLSKPKK